MCEVIQELRRTLKPGGRPIAGEHTRVVDDSVTAAADKVVNGLFTTRKGRPSQLVEKIGSSGRIRRRARERPRARRRGKTAWGHFRPRRKWLAALDDFRIADGKRLVGLHYRFGEDVGPDSLLARTAATMYGSSETTFYVLAVYFGAVGIRRTGHAVPAALVGDIVAAAAAVAVCASMFR
jgi:hypothetical protein